jgi:micrococcal nuclease
MIKKYFAISLILVCLCSVIVAACGNNNIEVSSSQVTIIDGDTIKIKNNNKEQTIRLLLIDTPELKHSTTGKQLYSEEAKAFIGIMIRNAKQISIEQDVSEKDKYGRLLAYVYADGKSVQEALLHKGLARVAYVYKPNIKNVDAYRSVENMAKSKKVGVWSIRNYVKDDGFHAEVIQNRAPIKSSIQAFVASKNSKVYHPRDCEKVVNTIKVENQIFFKSEEEAQASGRKRSQVPGCWK